MPNFNGGRTVAEHIRNLKSSPKATVMVAEADVSGDNSSRASKPASNTISSLLLSHFASTTCTTGTASSSQGKKKSAFRGLGCTASASQKVSVPAAIRSSAEWNGKKMHSNTLKQKKNVCSAEIAGTSANAERSHAIVKDGNGGNCLLSQDVWCGPGIGFSTEDAVFSPVEKDCVLPRRLIPGGRGRPDVEKVSLRERERDREMRRDRGREREGERPFVFTRRSAVNPNVLPFWETETSLDASRNDHDLYDSRYYRHVRHPLPDELAEVVSGFMMAGNSDRFSDWRLDIDEMSYEQLLELGDKIGYVSTGLKEDEITRCARKVKPAEVSALQKEKKCIICQEEFEGGDELGKLDCGHGFHYQCLKQWLGHRKCCPICKSEAVCGA